MLEPEESSISARSEGGATTLSGTMQLLSQYNDHTQERDKSLEQVEDREQHAGQADYDDLFKENVKLKLQLEEYETEIISLRKFIEVLKNNRGLSPDSIEQKLLVDEPPKEPTLPPRSAERKRNTKGLSLNAPSELHGSDLKTRHLLSPADPVPRGKSSIKSNPTVLPKPQDNDPLLSPRELDRIRRSSSSYSNMIAASPATSMAYTTSRISPSKSNKQGAKDDEQTTLASERSSLSRQESKIGGTPIRDTVSSPLRQTFGGNMQQALGDNPASKSYPKSPVPNLLANERGNLDFSPSSKQNLNNFAEMLESSFENQNSAAVDNGPSTRRSASPFLGSPVTLKKPMKSPLLSPNAQTRMKSLQFSADERPPTNLTSQTLLFPDQFSPRSFSNRSFPTAPNPSGAFTAQINREGSTKSLTDSQSVVSDIPLFIQPAELDSIRIDVISTFHRDHDALDDVDNILFSVIDKKSSQEMFRFSKTIDRIYELDVYLKCHMDTIILPPLPERQYFEATSPVKVDYRREKLNDYFSCLYSSPQLPPSVRLKMAKFISTDTVMNPPTGDYAKEGVLLLRKSKTLGTPSSWRVVYAALHGGCLSFLDKGHVTENIKLQHAVIELQANLPDDKHGTKNGFIVVVPKKGGLSSGTKYYFCCESPRERESWISNLTEFVEVSAATSFSVHNKSENSSVLDHSSVGNDTSTDIAPSYLGPMANLQEPVTAAPTQGSDVNITDEERESKRSRMRSFFPFKKASSQTPTHSEFSHSNGNERGASTTATNELSIEKSLQAMDLNAEPASDKVFGSTLVNCLSLSSHLYQGSYNVPSIVYRCMEYLYRNHGIEEEGIFRISGSTVLIKSLQERFDRDYDVDLCDFNKSVATGNNESSYTSGLVDVNTVTGLLKLYLRKLPHSIFGDDMFIEFKEVVDSNLRSPGQIALEYRRLINSNEMRNENLSLIYVLFELLVKINQKSAINKMNLRNLCIVFSPTLNIPVNVIQPFVVDFNCIFKNDDPISEAMREELDVNIPQL
ncbi:LADA_0C08548g1_1 [Lachancea dasiensis]|uniref:LADA_0C08548g1_1 n=1 Tax=Lachancea dasiensis TaxID=1072105 RepID=A0A1G4J014_9SACH|nr:LADA_0C08548g1_1 [Lachancea dasiensis]